MFTDRRNFLTAMAGLLATPAGAQIAPMGQPGMSRITAFAFSFAGLNGGNIRLGEYAGKPILIVNTASQCGYHPAICRPAGAVDALSRRGLLIVGVPSNDFGGQEPGGAGEITETRTNITPASRSPQRRWSMAPPRTRSTNGRRPSARSTGRAGTSTNI